MLKTQPKIWAIVIVACLIGELFMAGIPMIKESWNQLIAEKEEADRLAAEQQAANPTINETTNNNTDVGVESDQLANDESEDDKKDEEGAGFATACLIVLVLIALAVLVTTLF